MPLFKTLAKTSLGGISNDTPSASSTASTASTASAWTNEKSPAFPPTAIQLYSTKHIHFLSNTIQSYQCTQNNSSSRISTTHFPLLNGNNNSDDETHRKNLKYLPKQYEILSYQPIHVVTGSISTSGSTSKQQQQQQQQPNLGLWDCRCDVTKPSSSTSTTSILLQSPLRIQSSSSPSSSKPTFLITIDLDTYNLDKVQPTVTSMIHSMIHSIALVNERQRRCEERVKNDNNNHDDDDDDEKDHSNDKDVEKKDDNGNGTKNDNGMNGYKIDEVALVNLMNSIPKFGSAPSSSSSSSSSLPTLDEEEDDDDDEQENTKKDHNHNKKISGKTILNDLNVILCAILPYTTSTTSTTSMTETGDDSDENNNNNNNNNDGSNNPTSRQQPMTYKEKQALNLVIYHLLKYSNEINCTLCFLNQNRHQSRANNKKIDKSLDGNNYNNHDGDDKIDENGNTNVEEEVGGSSSMNGLVPHGMNLHNFGYILRQICLGTENLGQQTSSTSTAINQQDHEPIQQEEEDGMNVEEKKATEIENDNNTKEQQRSQDTLSIYHPNTYDIDLIESVYLRNASCAGVWDATSDNLWDALPSSTSQSPLASKSTKDKSNNSNGDEEWLTKLADSVTAYTMGGSSMDGTAGTTAGSGTGGKSVMMDESSLKSSRTTSKNTVVTTKSKRVVRKKVTKKSSSGGGSGNGKDDVSDFFTDLLKN